MSETTRNPEPGDLYVSEQSADFPVEWMVVGADPRRPGRLLVVAADSAPFAANADVAVPAEVPHGPLTLRPRFTVSVEAQDLAPDHRVGTLPERFVSRVRESSAALASGARRATVLEEETDADPEYRDWVEEVLEPACAALGVSGRDRSTQRAPQPARAARWPSTLAALFLLTSIGLSFWVAALRREVGRLSAPLVDPPRLEVVFGDAPRGPETLRAPAGASHVVIEVLLDAEIPAYKAYRMVLETASGRRVVDTGPRTARIAGAYQIVLPLASLPEGEYRLRLEGLSAQGATVIEERRLFLEHLR